uniref:Uncharacterized protein n=1 Tax=Brassica oleracea TaxID=3712 RepID=A0A3P6DK35_BRAOL|nr:unnamed protein product [Brassica oleracea]
MMFAASLYSSMFSSSFVHSITVKIPNLFVIERAASVKRGIIFLIQQEHHGARKNIVATLRWISKKWIRKHQRKSNIIKTTVFHFTLQEAEGNKENERKGDDEVMLNALLIWLALIQVEPRPNRAK